MENNTVLTVLPDPFETWEKMLLTSAICVIIIIALFGNFIVVLVFCSYKPLRRSTNTFMVSLALSDMLVGAVNMPIWIVNVVWGIAYTVVVSELIWKRFLQLFRRCSWLEMIFSNLREKYGSNILHCILPCIDRYWLIQRCMMEQNLICYRTDHFERFSGYWAILSYFHSWTWMRLSTLTPTKLPFDKTVLKPWLQPW